MLLLQLHFTECQAVLGVMNWRPENIFQSPVSGLLSQVPEYPET